METRGEQAGCPPDNPFAIPVEFLTPTPSVIPAQAGIQWFNYPFPRSGNDNRCDNWMRAFGQTGHPFTSRPALLDSGLRRNDDSGKNDGGGKINALKDPE